MKRTLQIKAQNSLNKMKSIMKQWSCRVVERKSGDCTRRLSKIQDSKSYVSHGLTVLRSYVSYGLTVFPSSPKNLSSPKPPTLYCKNSVLKKNMILFEKKREKCLQV